MRTLGITFVLAAAVVASMTIARQRLPERRPDPEPQPGSPLPLDADLEAIRAAGF